LPILRRWLLIPPIRPGLPPISYSLGLRIPVTLDAAFFADAVQLGREVIWLHTFGERFVSVADGRPARAPRLPQGRGPRIPGDGAIPSGPNEMPDVISYDAAVGRLRIGTGHIDNVPPEVWAYEISGKQVLTQWFSYRRLTRSRPIIGDRRRPSPLGDIQPSGWLAEYTTELLNVLHVLGRLVGLEPAQAILLDRICGGPLLAGDELRAAISAAQPGDRAKRVRRARPGRARDSRQMTLPR
jgi:hypothetical protein